jgi:two-component SAPR family response regulator
LRTLAICHQRIGQIEQAIRELQEALAIERQLGDLYNMARFQYDLGGCYESLGQLTTAEEYYTQADAYWATIGNRGLRAMSLNSRGVVQHLAGRYRAAHTTLTTALEHAEIAAAPSYQATVLASLGDLYSDLQLWDAAGAAYRDARQSGGSGYLVTYLEVMEAHLLTRQRAYALATRVLDQLPETTLAGHPITVHLLHGAIACGLGNFAQATLHADAVLEQARSPMDVARGHLLRARCLAHSQAAETAVWVAQLERAGEIADQLGHDSFLVVETLPIRAILRRAVAAGCTRAADWLQRHQELLLAAQMLGQEERSVILAVQTLGTDQISVNGQSVQLGWSKAREVFYYLLAHSDGATTETLRESIWPNLSAERSRDALKTAIYQLRAVLPREFIVLQGRQVYRLNRDVVWLDYDVERFLQLIDQQGDDPEALLEALDLYRGSYLPGTDNHWSSSLRTYLERRYLEALRIAAGRYEQETAYQDALTRYREIIAVDPLDEAAHAGAMRCYYTLGNRAAAIEQYRQLRRLLDDELGIEPEHTSEVERLYSRLVNTP